MSTTSIWTFFYEPVSLSVSQTCAPLHIFVSSPLVCFYAHPPGTLELWAGLGCPLTPTVQWFLLKVLNFYKKSWHFTKVLTFYKKSWHFTKVLTFSKKSWLFTKSSDFLVFEKILNSDKKFELFQKSRHFTKSIDFLLKVLAFWDNFSISQHF